MPMPSKSAVYLGASKLKAIWLLCAKVVNLAGLGLLNDSGQVAVGQVAVVQHKLRLSM